MLNNAVVEAVVDICVPTLRSDDFFVHLYSHLYKEATTLPWVEMMRDMTMYKYCDIYMLLSDAPNGKIDCLFNRAKELEMEKVCAFAVFQMSRLFLFENMYAVSVAEEILNSDPMFIHSIISPKEKKEYVFTQRDIEKRFFADNRKKLLQEVKEQ